MANFLLIAICLLAGFQLKKVKGFPQQAHVPINFWLIYIAVPAVTLRYIPTIQPSIDSFLPLSMALLVFVFSFLFFNLLGKLLHWEKTTIACLTVVAGLGNTSFIGFPLVEAFYGSNQLPIAILCDQGSFLVLSTLGILYSMKASSAENQKESIIKRLLRFPPFIAFCFSLVLIAFPLPNTVNTLLEKFAQTLVPLALFSVGLQLNFSKSLFSYKLMWGLSYKLLIAPMFIFLVFNPLLDNKMTFQTVVLEAAMAPMITAAIVASQYNLNQNLSNALVSIGIPLSFITTALWYFLL